MGCKKTAVRTTKALAEIVGPAGVRFLGKLVSVVEEIGSREEIKLKGTEKREIAVAVAQARMEIEEAAIRTVVEYAHWALTRGKAKLEDLGADDTAETVQV